MPLFCYVGHDAPGSAERRPDARPAHLAHLEPLAAEGRVRFAGPLFDEQGTPRGSLIVLEASDHAEARRVAEADPYLAHGVFERVEVFATTQVLPASADGTS